VSLEVKLEQHNQRLYNLEREQEKTRSRLKDAGINGHSMATVDVAIEEFRRLLDGDDSIGFKGLRQQVEQLRVQQAQDMQEMRQRQRRQDRILGVVAWLLVLLSLMAIPEFIELAARLMG